MPLADEHALQRIYFNLSYLSPIKLSEIGIECTDFHIPSEFE